LPGKQVSSIVVDPGRFFAAAFNEGVYYSDDNGVNWTNLDFNNSLPIPVFLLMVYENDLYVASQGVHIYNGNLNYVGTCGLEDKYVCNLLVKDNYLFAGTNADGVWKIPLSGLSVESDFLSDKLSLQAYPNPFNPSTMISFNLPNSQQIKLAVFNAKGQLVKTLFSGVMSAGCHTIRFDGSNLSSGIYFYRLSTQGSAQTKKMILMK